MATRTPKAQFNSKNVKLPPVSTSQPSSNSQGSYTSKTANVTKSDKLDLQSITNVLQELLAIISADKINIKEALLKT